MAAEWALHDQAIGRAVEDRAILLQLQDALRRLFRQKLDGAPVVKECTAAHRVHEVDLPRILLVQVRQRSGDPTLGHDCVRLAEQRLTHDADAQPSLPRCDRGP